MWPNRAASVIALLLTAALLPAARAAEPKPLGGPPEFRHLWFRLVGPGAGGRVSRVVGVPGDPRVYYFAASAGGVWKTVDGGSHWFPVFDEQPVSSTGSIALCPADPNVLYVGSGEANIRGNVEPGNGIYKSTDAGKTWRHVWKQVGQVGTMLVHPTNPDVAYAAVLGHAFGPNPERGVYRTTDGGKTWRQVLARDPDTGASDVCFDPSNPRILFAGLWRARRLPWTFTSGGPGSGLYVSRDGGDTWKQLTGHGLPAGTWGRIGVAVAPSDGRRVYALIEAAEGGLFRSDDGGENWERVNAGHFLRQRAWYFSTLTIDPRNPDVVWAPTVRLLRSIDGGRNFRQVRGLHHGDHHDLWIDPLDPKRMIDGNDGGVDITLNGGETWYPPELPICQFYHVAADNRFPYHVSGNMQDLATASGPSNSLTGGGIALSDWYEVGGGETGFTAPDPADPDIVYAGEYGGFLSRYDHRTRQARNVSAYPFNPSGHAASEVRYRFQWTAPILVSPHDPKVVYHAANVLFKTSDGGQHWTRISPDLTRNDRSKQQWSGGPITGDNTGAEYYDTIFAIAESPRQAGLLWAGSDDGLVHLTRDGGKTWTDVTPKAAGMPHWGTVNCIEPSPFDPGAAYLVVDNHRLDDMRPYLYKTEDFGQTWVPRTGGLPADLYLHAVREDPKRKGLLYAGASRGVWFSYDDGVTWRELKLNLPTVAVSDLLVKGDDLVLGTNGRSIWIFDDLTPIREWTPDIAKQAAHLFPTQAAVRWRYHRRLGGRGRKPIGDNPPVGASIAYYLKAKPAGPLTLTIRDAHGNVVETLSSVKQSPPMAADDPDAPEEIPEKTVLRTEVGVNRVTWNLEYAGAAALRHVKWDTGHPQVGPLATPGRYTFELAVDGTTLAGAVEVRPDPRVHIAPAALEEQLHFALALRDTISRTTADVSRLRAVRGQLLSRSGLLKDDPAARPLVQSSRDLAAKLDALEARLHNPKAQVVYDILAQRGGAQLYSQMIALFDWVKEADGPPTQGMRDQFAAQQRELKELESEWTALVTGDLARLERTARKLGIPEVIIPSKATAAPPAAAEKKARPR